MSFSWSKPSVIFYFISNKICPLPHVILGKEQQWLLTIMKGRDGWATEYLHSGKVSLLITKRKDVPLQDTSSSQLLEEVAKLSMIIVEPYDIMHLQPRYIWCP